MTNIICFGKNYDDHVREMQDKPVDHPVIFIKPDSVLKQCDAWDSQLTLYFPDDEIHYECELVFQLVSGGFQLTKQQAEAALGFYTVGLDMTKRVLQKQCKENGLPWTLSKVFPDSAVIGPWIPVKTLDHCLDQPFSFSLNHEVRQKSMGRNMLYSPVELLCYASRYFPLSAGDIIYTGTPAGVGKIAEKDIATAMLDEHVYEVRW